MTSPPVSIHAIARIDSTIEPFDWHFARERADEIDANWRAALAEKPLMFDGRVFLMHRCEIVREGGTGILRAAHFETGFRSFIGWRDLGFPDAGVRNCFSMGALRSCDGAYVLVCMAGHTANAGRIYFPAGTPDLKDVDGDSLDLAGSIVRELAEETGLAPPASAFAEDWRVLLAGPRVACMKRIDLDEDAETIAARIEHFIAHEENAELDGVHIVRSQADLDTGRMPGFVLAYLEDELSASA